MSDFDIPTHNDQFQFYNDFDDSKRSQDQQLWTYQVKQAVKDNYALAKMKGRLGVSDHKSSQVPAEFKVNTNNRTTVLTALGRMQTWSQHRDKLDEIKQSPRRSNYAVDPTQIRIQKKLSTQKKQNSSFVQTQREDNITKTNQHLLKHLLEIGQGKQCSLPKNTKRSFTLSDNLDRISRQSYHFQSKKEASRIDFENKKLMERIIQSAGTVKKVQQNLSFQKHLAYKELHARNESSFIAEQIWEKSSRFKDSVMTSYMLPSISMDSRMSQTQQRSTQEKPTPSKPSMQPAFATIIPKIKEKTPTNSTVAPSQLIPVKPLKIFKAKTPIHERKITEEHSQATSSHKRVDEINQNQSFGQIQKGKPAIDIPKEGQVVAKQSHIYVEEEVEAEPQVSVPLQVKTKISQAKPGAEMPETPSPINLSEEPQSETPSEKQIQDSEEYSDDSFN